MKTKLTNLIPEENVRKLRRTYYLRLATTVVSALAILIAIHGILLIPSYRFAVEEAAAHEAHLAEIERSYGSDEERSITDRLETLAKNAQHANTLMGAPSASAAIRSVLAVPRPGIAVNRFALDYQGAQGKMTVSGEAANRESLRAYHLALESLAFVAQAELPLSAYAAERDIPFTVTLTLKTP